MTDSGRFKLIHLTVLIVALFPLFGLTSLALRRHAEDSRRHGYQQSIRRGLVWINSSSHNVSPYQWLLIDYMRRQYTLGPAYDAKDKTFTFGDQQNKLEFDTFKRIIDPLAVVSSLPLKNASIMDQMMMEAANCDHIPLPANFRQLSQANIVAGGYNMTHVAFSLERIEENGCPLRAEDNSAMRQEVATKMAMLVENPSTTTDLRYESIAFLQTMGEGKRLSAATFQKIVAEQRPSGAWGETAHGPDSDHATVLAVWSLLQHVQHGLPTTPMIRHPSQ